MICRLIQRLINYGIGAGLIEPLDELVVRNSLMDALRVYDWTEQNVDDEEVIIDDLLEEIVSYACGQGIIADTAASRDLFDTKIMGILTPMPREVNRRFFEEYKVSPENATDWYYGFSRKLNYVRAGRIARDKIWEYKSEYGILDITINKSKPEKDPRDIAAAGAAKAAQYPKCQLCAENAGFAGNLRHPARQNLRPVSVRINGGGWELQYSPYGYYNEHCILFNDIHTPMVINREVFEKLSDAVEQFPHYFFGSNADLPIVGGSILSHEHFQGGRYTFAMEKAPVEKAFTLGNYPDVKAGTVKWPMSVIRVSSENKEQLVAACTEILDNWRKYTDESVGICAFTGNTPHNTITPIARRKGAAYEFDLVLRNNRTSEERPLGIFHPNPSLHHIKKENIGLIEVMGLAVLPSRLEGEMNALKEQMLSGKIEQSPHTAWAEDILARRPEFSENNADEILNSEIGAVFEQILHDAGVFKRNAEGAAAFERFVGVIGGSF